MEEILDRCKRLDSENQRLRSANGLDPVEIDIAAVKASHLNSLATAKSTVSSGKGFHLSPLPVELPLLTTSSEGFQPLAEDEDELDGEMFEDDSGNTKPLIEPISIPSRSKPILSANAMTMPTDDHWGSNSPSSLRSIHALKPATSYSSMNSGVDGHSSSARGINPLRQQGYNINSSFTGASALKDILDGGKGSPTDSSSSRGRAGSTASLANNARRSSNAFSNASQAQPINIGLPRRTGSPQSFSASPENRARGDSTASSYSQRRSLKSSASEAARAMERPSSTYNRDGRGASQDRTRVRIPV